MTGGILLTRHQSCCILALAFFSLLPSSSKHGSRYQHLDLSAILEYGFFASQQSKCLCLVGYFDRLMKAEFAGDEEFFKRCITIERKVLERELSTKEFWSKSEIPLGPFEIDAVGVIEDSHGSLQIDFANEYIGGGVLQQGNVQVKLDNDYLLKFIEPRLPTVVLNIFSFNITKLIAVLLGLTRSSLSYNNLLLL